MRRLAVSFITAILTTILLAGVAVASPWQMQTTTCLLGPNNDVPGHVYVHENTGKVVCRRDH